MWRTATDVARSADWWPFIVTGVFLFIALPSFGLIVFFLGVLVDQTTYFRPLAVFFLFSPFWMFLGLLTFIPAMIAFAYCGYAGWAVATSLGTIAAGITISTSTLPLSWLTVFIGTTIGGVYWLIVRCQSPTSIGLKLNSTK